MSSLMFIMNEEGKRLYLADHFAKEKDNYYEIWYCYHSPRRSDSYPYEWSRSRLLPDKGEPVGYAVLYLSDRTLDSQLKGCLDTRENIDHLATKILSDYHKKILDGTLST